MLNEKHAGDTASVRRFVNESRAIAMLSSDHIVDIYDVAFTGRNKYLVMEYIEGVTLREYMKRNAPLGLEKSLDFTIQILSALQHAHEKGVVHRDIKPQNIMVQANGKLKVTDFGIAQISDTNQSSSGVAMGTVYYISPEQASGKTTTFSSDIYSVGIMLYEMATGKLPFEGDTPLSIAMMQVNTKPCRPRKIDPKIPLGLEQIILRAINKAPQDRFRSARSMLRALEIVKKDKTVVFEENRSAAKAGTAPAKTPADEKKKESKRPVKAASVTLFPIILGVASAFLLVCLIAGVILLTSLIQMTSEDNTLVVPIPQLVGQELNDAMKANLATQNIVLEVTQVNNDNFAAGQITTQNPAAGQTRKVASQEKMVTVQVEVSLGKSNFTLENYANKEYRKVKLALENLGAKVSVEEVFDANVISGYVISSKPEAGASVKSGDTVTLVISKGAETAYSSMINVVGMTEGEAKRKLLNANFIVGRITKDFSDTIPEGKVITQSIAAGTKTAQKYTAVDLVVSLGPRK
jgi:serine/threonine-protein kinase